MSRYQPRELTPRQERTRTAVKISVLWVSGAFVATFVFGALIGVADPDGGWAPWRVGLLMGVIMSAAVTICALIGSLLYIFDP